MMAKVLSLAQKRGWKALEKALERDRKFESKWGTSNPVGMIESKPGFDVGMELRMAGPRRTNWQQIVSESADDPEVFLEMLRSADLSKPVRKRKWAEDLTADNPIFFADGSVL